MRPYIHRDLNQTTQYIFWSSSAVIGWLEFGVFGWFIIHTCFYLYIILHLWLNEGGLGSAWNDLIATYSPNSLWNTSTVYCFSILFFLNLKLAYMSRIINQPVRPSNHWWFSYLVLLFFYKKRKIYFVFFSFVISFCVPILISSHFFLAYMVLHILTYQIGLSQLYGE